MLLLMLQLQLVICVSLVVAPNSLIAIAPDLHGRAIREVYPDGVLRRLTQSELLLEVLAALASAGLYRVDVPSWPQDPQVAASPHDRRYVEGVLGAQEHADVLMSGHVAKETIESHALLLLERLKFHIVHHYERLVFTWPLIGEGNGL